MSALTRNQNKQYEDVIKTDQHRIHTANNIYLDSTAQSGLTPLGLNKNILKQSVDLIEKHPVLQYKNFDYELIRKASDILCEDTDLSYVYWTLCSSLATEAAIKMCYRVSGKMGLIGIPEGYNGCTLPSNSVNYHYDRSTVYKHCSNFVNYFQDTILESIKKHHNKCCAVIIEPLIYQKGCENPGDYGEITRLCKKYNLPLIIDETFTGGYRTGTKWFYTTTKLEPDLVVVGKGINNGAVSVGALLIGNDFYQKLNSNTNGCFEFFQTQAGNPIACASTLVGMSKLKIYQTKTKEFEKSCRDIFQENLVKQFGYLFCLKNIHNYSEQNLLDRGVLAKVRVDSIICTPPLSWSADQLLELNTAIYS